MALQLPIYKDDTFTNKLESTYLGIGNGFMIQLHKNRFYDLNFGPYWKPKEQGFTGIMLDNIALNFQTSWGDAGGAIIGKKIESIVNSKFVKMLAGQSGNGFQPFICADAWTQQKVSGEAQPVKVQLKFKAYNQDRMGCTNYNDIIPFLIQICSPIKSSTSKLGDDIAATLNNVAEGGSQVIGTVVNAGKQFANGFSNKRKGTETDDQMKTRQNAFASAAASLVETANDVYNKTVSETGSGKNNANFTVLFSLGDVTNHVAAVNEERKKQNLPTITDIHKIKSSNIDVSRMNEKAEKYHSSFAIDWIVESFNFKPSRQFEMVNGLPKPLWIDFEVSLETRLSLSNKYVYNLIVADKSFSSST
jgi:hypothetical protein